MMIIRVRVRKVDMDGYNGREHHPSREDEGQEGVVTNIELVPDEEMSDDDQNYPHRANYPPALKVGYQVFFVVLGNGHEVELMGHEIELMSVTHDGDL